MKRRRDDVRIPKRPAPKPGTLYLYRELKQLDVATSPFMVEADESNLTKWSVGITSGALKEHLDMKPLASQLEAWHRASGKPPVILMEIQFPTDYPLSVPFVRMIRPRFVWHTGHVTIGGSLCTELLTPAGWREMNVHTLLLTICQMLREGGAKIQMRPDEHCFRPLTDYSEVEARDAFRRVAQFHGWSLHAKPAERARS